MKDALIGWLFLHLVAASANGLTPNVGQTEGRTSSARTASNDTAATSLRLSSYEPQPTDRENEEADEPKTRGFYVWPDRPPLEGSLATDRPGFSDTYALVSQGYHHLELGYSFYYDHEESTRTKNHTLGEFSLRTGLTGWFELRIKWTGFSFTESHFDDVSRLAGRHITRTDHDDGGTDMSIGFKSPLLKQEGLIPNLSIIPAISLPTGSSSKSTGDVDPEVRLAWNYGVTDKLTVYGVGSAAWLSDEEGRFFQAGTSLAAFYQFTPQVGGFVEYYGLYPSTRDSDCQHNLDFGPVFLINDNFQIDVRAGFGLNEEAPDFQAGIGSCYRI